MAKQTAPSPEPVEAPVNDTDIVVSRAWDLFSRFVNVVGSKTITDEQLALNCLESAKQFGAVAARHSNTDTKG